MVRDHQNLQTVIEREARGWFRGGGVLGEGAGACDYREQNGEDGCGKTIWEHHDLSGQPGHDRPEIFADVTPRAAPAIVTKARDRLNYY
jgi:hypothetical protein